MLIKRYHLLAAVLFCVPGLAENDPISLDTANHATGYMEWILEARFTAEQRDQYQQMLAGMWREGSKNSISAMARAHETLQTMDESKRAQMRAEKQPQFVRLLEGATDDKSRWLLGIYRAAHSQPAVARDVPTAGAPLGRWTDGQISSIQYQNATTGVSAPTNGRSFAYEFKADGTYSFTGLMQSVMYNCTTAMFSNESGTYTVNGDSIALNPEKNPYRMTNNCAPSSNRDAAGKLVPRTYRFRVASENGRRYLEFRGSDGSTQKFGAQK
jgi:hypothetical protein